MAIRHPDSGINLLARTFARNFEGAPWISGELKLKFCILFLGNLIDGSVERDLDHQLVQKVLKKPMQFGIRLLKRSPDEGLRMLVALVMHELREEQRYSDSDFHKFYEEVIVTFFPEAPIL